MTMTQSQGLTPEMITATQAEVRVKGIVELFDHGENVDAMQERAKLFLDTLYTIAHAPTMADKRELKRLAALALEAFEIPITKG